MMTQLYIAYSNDEKSGVEYTNLSATQRPSTAALFRSN